MVASTRAPSRLLYQQGQSCATIRQTGRRAGLGEYRTPDCTKAGSAEGGENAGTQKGGMVLGVPQGWTGRVGLKGASKGATEGVRFGSIRCQIRGTLLGPLGARFHRRPDLSPFSFSPPGIFWGGKCRFLSLGLLDGIQCYPCWPEG